MARQSEQLKGFGRSVAAPASTGVWEMDIRPMAAWVDGASARDPGYRPSLLIVVEARSGLVRAMQPERPEDALAALPAVLSQAAEAPPAGCRRGRPSRVVVGDAALLEPLAALLPGVAVRQGPTPQLDQAFGILSESVLGADLDALFEEGAEEATAPATWLGADCSPADVAAFFEAAAALHQRRPWKHFPVEGHLFRVTSTPLGIQQWLGFADADQNDDSLVLFRSQDDYWEYERLNQRLEHPADRGDPLDAPWPPHLAINFVPLKTCDPGVRAEIREHGWTVCSGAVVPKLLDIQADHSLARPTADLLRQLQAVCRGLAEWIDNDPDPATRWLIRQQPRRYRVPVGDAVVPVSVGAFAGPPRALSSAQNPLQLRVDALLQSLDALCSAHLNPDYRALFHSAVAALARQQPSPLLKGRESSWCAGLAHAIGAANFLFVSSQTPHCTIKELFAFFGVSSSVGYAHSKKVRELLGIESFAPHWTLASLQEPSAEPLMVRINGMMIDASKLPADVKMRVCAQLISLGAGSTPG